MMLSPDLLDRRALALLALADQDGVPVDGSVELTAAGVRHCQKPGGRIAILEAPGFAPHSAAFAAPPPTPSLRSRRVVLDLVPSDRRLMPRRFTLRLPRDPDPANRAQPTSLFTADPVVFSHSPRVVMNGTRCVVRVSVTESGSGALVGNALVRARTATGAMTVWAQSDIAGQAALVFSALPLSFARAGGGITPEIEASVVVHADPDSVILTRPEDLLAAHRAPAPSALLDPDSLAAATPPAFAGGATVQLAANRQISLSLQWTAP